MQPTIGRIVHYLSHDAPPQTRAAIITRVHTERCVDLCIFSPTSGPYAMTSVVTTGDGEPFPGCWTWPPREGEGEAVVLTASAQAHERALALSAFDAESARDTLRGLARSTCVRHNPDGFDAAAARDTLQTLGNPFDTNGDTAPERMGGGGGGGPRPPEGGAGGAGTAGGTFEPIPQTVRLGGRGGQAPGEDGEDGQGIGGGRGGKAGEVIK